MLAVCLWCEGCRAHGPSSTHYTSAVIKPENVTEVGFDHLEHG